MTPSRPDPFVLRLERLGAAQQDQVRDAAREATRTDTVAPLSEDFTLALTREGADHRLLTDGDRLVGYAQVARDGAVEAFVVPDRRRGGHGRRLLEGVLADIPGARLWAHGDLPGARALADRLGLTKVRELLVLDRPLEAADATPPTLPAGYTARAFRPGQDDAALLTVNAAAFADHPEQGRLDQRGLDERMAQPWFDPAGLLLVEADDGTLAAFHWTKVPTDQHGPEGAGEVYVVGVRPDQQGRGLGSPLTRLGLAHLAALGLGRVELYVEGDNAPALSTYRRAGFTQAAAHAMYARTDRTGQG